MPSGENKCVACGQYAGHGHHCPPPATATPERVDAPAAPVLERTDVNDRVARAQRALETGAVPSPVGSFTPSPEDEFTETPWTPYDDVLYKTRRSATIMKNRYYRDTPLMSDDMLEIREEFDAEAGGYRLQQRPMQSMIERMSGLTRDGLGRWSAAYADGRMTPDQQRDYLERLDRAAMLDVLDGVRAPGTRGYRETLEAMRAEDPPPTPPPVNPARVPIPEDEQYIPDPWEQVNDRAYATERAASRAYTMWKKEQPEESAQGLEVSYEPDSEAGGYIVRVRPSQPLASRLTGLTQESFDRRLTAMREGTLLPAEEYDLLDRMHEARMNMWLQDSERAKYEQYRQAPPGS